MEIGHIFISVWNCRAVVSRYVAVAGEPHAISCEPATNWEALADEAEDAVNDAGGAVTMSGHYPCPATIADRALF